MLDAYGWLHDLADGDIRDEEILERLLALNVQRAKNEAQSGILNDMEMDMRKCKITVLRRMYNQDFAEQFTQSVAPKCDSFQDGQEFIVENMARPPEDFCAWAWIDLQRSIQTLLRGGNFSDTGWMKKDNVLIACCSDGIRPVVFKLERIDE